MSETNEITRSKSRSTGSIIPTEENSETLVIDKILKKIQAIIDKIFTKTDKSTQLLNDECYVN